MLVLGVLDCGQVPVQRWHDTTGALRHRSKLFPKVDRR